MHWNAILLSMLLSAPTADLEYEWQSEDANSPFQVFVYEAKKSEDGEAPLAEVTKSVRKAITARDKWFSVIDNPLEADVLVEVWNEWNEGDEPAVVNRDTLSPISTPDVKGAVIRPGAVGKGEHTIEIRYSIPNQFEKRIVVTGKNRETAAREVPRSLRTICQAYCREPK